MGDKKTSEDLAYVRSALERQRRLACEFIPVWFAAVVAVYFILVSGSKDLVNQGFISGDYRDTFRDVAQIFLFGTLILYFWRMRKKRREQGTARPKPSGKELWFMMGPAIILIAGVMYVVALAKMLDFGSDTMRPFVMSQLAFMMMLVGFKSVRAMFWFGFGLAVGGFWLFTLSSQVPYNNTLFSLIVAGFFVFGAWREQKLRAA